MRPIVELEAHHSLLKWRGSKTTAQGGGTLGGARGPKTIVASWHCHPESFCASGKFLRVTLEIALGRFRTVSKVSGWSRKFMDDLDIFQIAWKFSRLPGKIPDSVDTS